MIRRIAIVGSGLSLLLIAILLAIYLFEPDKETTHSLTEKPLNRIITREAEAKGAHYMNYVQDGTLYLEDRNTNRITSLGRINNTVHEVMKITHGKAITSNTYISGTSLIDPVSLNIGIRQSIPYTYDSDLAMSSIYIESLLEDGWDIIGYYGDADYIDYFISKQGAVSRVILLSKSMKVFYDIQGDIPDPLKFTTKR